jgi:hypothetical protein
MAAPSKPGDVFLPASGSRGGSRLLATRAASEAEVASGISRSKTFAASACLDYGLARY